MSSAWVWLGAALLIGAMLYLGVELEEVARALAWAKEFIE